MTLTRLLEKFRAWGSTRKFAHYSLSSYIALHLLWVTVIVVMVALISLTYTHSIDARDHEVEDLMERVQNYVFVLGSMQRLVKYRDLEKTATSLVQDKNLESIRALTANHSVIIEVHDRHAATEYHDTLSYPVYFDKGIEGQKLVGHLEFRTATSRFNIVLPPAHILLPAVLVCLIFAYLARRMLDASIVKPIRSMHRNIAVYDGVSWPDQEIEGPRELADLNQALRELMTTVSENTAELDTQNRELQEQFKINRQAQRELFELQKRESLTHFSSGISHDFNNILMTILGNLEIMQVKTADEGLLQHLDTCIDTVTYASGLTSKLLNISRDGEFSPARVSLADVLKKQSQWVGRILPDNIQIEWHLPDEKMFVFLDESMLVSALLNLIVNARDAMAGGGKIRVTVAQVDIEDNVRRLKGPLLQTGTYYIVEIADTGTGIPLHQQKKIFEPFFTSKAEGAGTGLGLAMVKSFVEQSNGKLSVDSVVGKGTTFQLYFPPHHESEETTGPDGEHWVDPANFRDTRVLIVEDNASVQAILVAMLEQAVINVESVSIAAEAQQIIRESETGFDILITDANLRGKLQGMDLIDDYGRKSRDIGIILMSGNVFEATQFRENAGVQYEFLQKPFTRKDLFSAMALALRNRNLEHPAESEEKSQEKTS